MDLTIPDALQSELAAAFFQAAVTLMLVGADCAGILSDWREPATLKFATASSMPKAGTASTGSRLPETAMGETDATNDS